MTYGRSEKLAIFKILSLLSIKYFWHLFIPALCGFEAPCSCLTFSSPPPSPDLIIFSLHQLVCTIALASCVLPSHSRHSHVFFCLPFHVIPSPSALFFWQRNANYSALLPWFRLGALRHLPCRLCFILKNIQRQKDKHGTADGMSTD